MKHEREASFKFKYLYVSLCSDEWLKHDQHSVFLTTNEFGKQVSEELESKKCFLMFHKFSHFERKKIISKQICTMCVIVAKLY